MWNTFGVRIPALLTRGAPLRGDPWLLSATASRYFLDGVHSVSHSCVRCASRNRTP
jgi:hypothetical protein